jgi:hypothetical protein
MNAFVRIVAVRRVEEDAEVGVDPQGLSPPGTQVLAA